ncbi:methyltransferase SirN-like protein [Stachybotrys elegans]|uniref:Methyltransferase SirN-like protein n=1 Tax=Stachybotrys elegans TaxID=80388 RepID=A0A8K0SIG2_9HYPO|nr:methyltransferase SirN-like protein [Stachybotrys elegans]
MSEDAPEYILPEPAKEVERLTEQDAVITYHMGGKRILAPLDLSQPGLQILDSGTADGLWLREIQPLLVEPYSLRGFDIMPSFFPSETPPHTTLEIHDITEPWPEQLHGQFDLVHQRATLLGGGMKSSARECVRLLVKLVKPGGWIQLGENDVSKPVHGGPAMHHVWQALAVWFDTASRGDGQFASKMASWLLEEGFENVREEYINIDIGPRCKDPEWGARSAKVMLNAAVGVVGAIPMLKAEIAPEVVEKLPERVTEEWVKDGATYGFIYVVGQKPLACRG